MAGLLQLAHDGEGLAGESTLWRSTLTLPVEAPHPPGLPSIATCAKAEHHHSNIKLPKHSPAAKLTSQLLL